MVNEDLRGMVVDLNRELESTGNIQLRYFHSLATADLSRAELLHPIDGWHASVEGHNVLAEAAFSDLGPSLEFLEIRNATLRWNAFSERVGYARRRRRSKFGIVFGEADPPRLQLQITAFLQPHDRFGHHAMAEMPLPNAQQFRAVPFSLDRLDLLGWRYRVEFTSYEKNASRITKRLIMQR